MTESNKKTSKRKIRPTSRALSIALLRTREHVMIPIRPILAELGMTEQKWRILRILAESGPMDQTTLADEACLLLSSVTRILNTMEKDGHIIRIQNDDDRRSNSIHISDDARKLVGQHQPSSQAIYGKLREELGEERLEELIDLLEEVQQVEF